jgi:hypothetical protein
LVVARYRFCLAQHAQQGFVPAWHKAHVAIYLQPSAGKTNG